MANSLIYFGTLSGEEDNTLTDSELLLLSDTAKQGIEFGTTAYSDILNGLLRQITKTNKVFGDLISLKSGQDINTTITNTQYQDRIELAIENIAKEVTVTKLAAQITAATATKITFNSDGLVTGGAAIAYSDLPNVAQFNFIGRTTSGTGSVTSITRDNVIGVSTNGYIKRTGANAYTADDLTFAQESTVALRATGTPVTPTFWVGTQSQYDGVSPKLDNVIYIIT